MSEFESISGESKWEKYFTWFALLLVLGAVFTIRLGLLQYPLERDEGTYLYFGSLILDGQLPYEAFYDPKPVGLFYTYAFILHFFGHSLEQLHLAFLLINVVSVCLVYKIGRTLYGNPGGLAAAAALAFLSLHPQMGGPSILSEHLVMLFVNAGLLTLLLAQARNRTLWYFASGLILGSALCQKQNAIFFMAAAFIYLLSNINFRNKIRWQLQVNQLIYFAFGCGLPFACFYAYFVFKGLHSEFLYWNILYPVKYSNDVPLAVGIKYLAEVLTKLNVGYTLWYVLALLGLLSIFFRSEVPRKYKVFLVLLLSFSLLSVTPRLTFHGHYFLLINSSLALLVGFLFYYLSTKIGWPSTHRFISAMLPACVLLLVIFHIFGQRKTYFSPEYSLLFREVYGNNPFLETVEIANGIKLRATAKDQMIVFGAEMQLYYYTDLKGPTKHLYGPYLVDGSMEHRSRQQEFIKDLEKHKPRFFVSIYHPLSWMVKPGSDLTIMSWYTDFTTKHYRLIGLADMFQDQPSIYIWDDELSNYEQSGSNQIYVWELADSTALK